MRTAARVFPLSVACLLVVLGAVSCRPGSPDTSSATSSADAAPEYEHTATIKDLMISVIDPNADVIWNAVSSVASEKGIVDTMPRTDEDWAAVRHGAMTLAESATLLMMPGRRVARPGEKSETPGVELEPEEMDALIAKDRAAWNERAAALRTAAREVLAAVDAKDAGKVFEIGERIELACEGCHSQYWYPGEVLPDLPSLSAPPSPGPSK